MPVGNPSSMSLMVSLIIIIPSAGRTETSWNHMLSQTELVIQLGDDFSETF